MQRSALIAALVLASCLAFAARPVLAPVKNHHAVFTAPPRHTPAADAVDAPLLGNGSMLAALAGAPRFTPKTAAGEHMTLEPQ